MRTDGSCVVALPCRLASVIARHRLPRRVRREHRIQAPSLSSAVAGVYRKGAGTLPMVPGRKRVYRQPGPAVPPTRGSCRPTRRSLRLTRATHGAPSIACTSVCAPARQPGASPPASSRSPARPSSPRSAGRPPPMTDTTPTTVPGTLRARTSNRKASTPSLKAREIYEQPVLAGGARSSRASRNEHRVLRSSPRISA